MADVLDKYKNKEKIIIVVIVWEINDAITLYFYHYIYFILSSLTKKG